MKLNDLKRLTKQGESETLEFKKSTAQLSAAFETLCAFLNNKGGIVLVGVTNNGQLIGQQVSDNTKQEIAQEQSKIEPHAQIDIHYVPLKENKQIIVLATSAGKHAPYTYDGRTFQRHQSTTRRMSQHRYEQLLIEREQLNHSWETFVADGYSIEQLDHNLILGVMRKGVQRQRLPEIALRQEIPQLLEGLELLCNGQPRNAAIVLFGTKFMPNYPQCQLKIARFKGIDRHEFLDSDLIYGNAFELLERGMLFVKRHLPLAAKVEAGKLERTEKLLIPFDAIREALINALCHRDYSARGGSIGLAIYEDRMEIFNDGGLLKGVTLEKIKSGFSKLRNPIIADVFYKSQLIEKWGRGIQEIIKSCMVAGDPEPEFIADESEFKVIFPFPGSIRPEIALPKSDDPNLRYLTKRQRQIIQILAPVEEMKISEIMLALKESLSERTLRDDLAKLRTYKLVGLRGHAKTAVWFLIK